MRYFLIRSGPWKWRGILGFALAICALAVLALPGALPAQDAAARSIPVVLSTEAESFSPGSSISVTALFGEAVEGFLVEDIVVAGRGGTVSGLRGEGAQYVFDVTPFAMGDGAVAIQIPGLAAAEAGGTPTAASNILRIAPAEGLDPSLRVYYGFDENDGVLAYDGTLWGNDGVLSRGARVNDGFSFASHSAWGTRRGALRLDGTVAEVSIPPLHLNSNRVTMAAWIRREEGAPMTGSGIIFSNGTDPGAPSNGSPCGLTIEDTDELNYCWGDNLITWNWRSGLKAPANKWVHAALVVAPEKATLYLTEDGATRAVERRTAHPPMPFDRSTRVGVNWGYALFKGSVDEVRIYDRSLSAEEIAALASASEPDGSGGPSVLQSATLVERSAVAGWPYFASLRGARASLQGARGGSFQKISGPAWLEVSEDGTLTGTPSAADVGSTVSLVRVREKGVERDVPVQIAVLPAGQAVEVASAVNPVWMEGAVDRQAVELAGLLNDTTPVRIVRQSATRWYADNSGAPASLPASGGQLSSPAILPGLLLPGDRATLTVIARYGSGGTRSVKYALSLLPTDLAGKSAAKDMVTLRPGDSLWLTATGPGAALEIADPATGTFESVGAPGAAQAVRFDHPGLRSLSARIDGEERGALRVRVLAVNLSDSGRGLACDNDRPIAVEKGYAREKLIRIEPLSAAKDLCFTASDPEVLAVAPRDGLLPTTSCLSLLAYAATTTATVEVQARLGGPDGPIVASHPVVCFEVTSTAATRAPVIQAFEDGSSLCSATLSVRPPVPGLDFHMVMWGEGGTWADSTRDLFFTSADLDAQGDYVYGMIQPGGGSLCHSLRCQQDGVPLNKRGKE